MNESGVYTETDLQPFRERLEELRQVIQQEAHQDQLPPAMEKLLVRKLTDCGTSCLGASSPSGVCFALANIARPLDWAERVLDTLFKSLSVLSVELVPIHQRLVQM